MAGSSSASPPQSPSSNSSTPPNFTNSSFRSTISPATRDIGRSAVLPLLLTLGFLLTVGAAVVDGRTVTIRFLDPAGGKRHAGVVVVDYLHSKGVGAGWIRNTETFTVVGPPGTTLLTDTDRIAGGGRRPADDGRRVTWRGSTGDRFEADFRDDTYLVFAPAGTPPWRVDLALGLTIAPIWIANLRAFTFPVGLLYGAFMVGVAVATRAVADFDVAPDRLAAGVAMIGGAIVLLFTVSSYSFLFGALRVSAMIYLVTGAVAVARPATFRFVRGAVGVGLLGLATGAVVFGIVPIFTDAVGLATAGSPIATAARMAAGSLPVAIAPAFGVACTARWDQGTRLAGGLGCLRPWVGALGGYVLAGAIVVPFGEVADGLAIVGYLALAVFLGVFSFPPALLAARIWTEQRKNVDGPVDGPHECTGRQNSR